MVDKAKDTNTGRILREDNVSPSNGNQQNSSQDIDAKNKQGRFLKDIIPPLMGKTPAASEKPQIISQKSEPDKARVPIPIVTTGTPKNIPPTQKINSQIPKFDLAEDIMAEHRKISAIKRTAPGPKRIENVKDNKIESINNNIIPIQSAKMFDNEDKLIAEVVARDIEKLLHGQSLDN